MNAVQCPTMAAASGLSETMILDDDSGAHAKKIAELCKMYKFEAGDKDTETFLVNVQ